MTTDNGRYEAEKLGRYEYVSQQACCEDAGHLIGFKSPIVRATKDKYTKDIAVSSQWQIGGGVI